MTVRTGRRPALILAKHCSDKLVNQPGKVFDYNNADYIVPGKLIERLHGRTSDQVLGEMDKPAVARLASEPYCAPVTVA